FLTALRGAQGGQALDAVNQAIQLAGPQAPLLDTRGVVRTALGQTSAAIEDFKRAISEEPSAATQFRLAYAYWKQGDASSAKTALNLAVEEGLKESDLHPLERKHLEELRAATAA